MTYDVAKLGPARARRGAADVQVSVKYGLRYTLLNETLWGLRKWGFALGSNCSTGHAL